MAGKKTYVRDKRMSLTLSAEEEVMLQELLNDSGLGSAVGVIRQLIRQDHRKHTIRQVLATIVGKRAKMYEKARLTGRIPKGPFPSRSLAVRTRRNRSWNVQQVNVELEQDLIPRS
jgi:hypothetical protein